MFDTTAITNAGAALLAEWIVGSTFTITRAAAGSGTDSDLQSATQLHSEKQQMSIVSVKREDNAIILRLRISAGQTAFTMQQIGVWGKIGNGSPVLVAIYQDAVGIPVPQASTSQTWDFTFLATITVSNTGTLSVTIDTQAAVTIEMLEDALEDKQDAIEAVGLLKRLSDGSIVAAQPGTDYDTSSGAFHASSSTASGTATKTVYISDLSSLRNGNLFVISFSNANTAANPKLKINSLTAKSIVSPGQSTLDSRDYWKAGEYVLLLYDGTNFVLLDRFIRYVAQNMMGVANGIATLGSDGKVLADQLRGGFIVSASAPADTSLLWIDTNSVMRYYNAGTWKTIVPTWG